MKNVILIFMKQPDYFTATTFKFVIMSFFTFGFYEFYWFYKNWSLYKERTGYRIMPIMRSLFAIFWARALFNDMVLHGARGALTDETISKIAKKHPEKSMDLPAISEQKQPYWEERLGAKITPLCLAIIYALMLVTLNFPEPFNVVAHFSFIPLLVMNSRAQTYMQFSRSDFKANSRLGTLNWIFIILGAFSIFALVFNSFLSMTGTENVGGYGAQDFLPSTLLKERLGS